MLRWYIHLVFFGKSCRFQVFLIILTWIFGLAVFIPFLFTGDITYNSENEIFQVPLRLFFAIIYVAFIIYIILSMILNVIYFKLVEYIRQMLRNLVTISTILVILAFLYAIFISMSFLTRIPKYRFSYCIYIY